MKARVLEIPKPFEVRIKETEVKEPGPDEVMIETLYTLISTGTELTAYTGNFPPGSAWARYVRYPFYPGYCNVGRVVAVGEGVNELKEGDLVVCNAPHTDLFTWKAREIEKVPPGVDAREAVFHTLAAGVMHSVRLAGVRLGEAVVIVGAGLIGQMAIQFSRLAGGVPVVAVDLSDYRLELARKSGADRAVNPRREIVAKAVADATEGRMADVVFEATGNPDVLPQAIRLAREMGRLVVLSSPRGPTKLDFHDEVNRPSRTIIGTHFSSQPGVETPYYQWTWSRNKQLFFTMLLSGRISVRHLISHVIPFERAKDAYKMLYENRLECMGVLLEY